MKKILLSIIVATTLSTSLISCQNKENKHTEHGSNTSTDAYTCPMHPEVMADKPGACPTCGMNLVKKRTDKME